MINKNRAKNKQAYFHNNKLLRQKATIKQLTLSKFNDKRTILYFRPMDTENALKINPLENENVTGKR